MIEWIKTTITKYHIDGIRIDTVPEVPKWFWPQFTSAAGVFQVGEVFNNRIDYVADYQNYMDSVLNYPLFYAFKDVFMYEKSMNILESTLQQIDRAFKDSSVLGVFVNNHDNSRFLYTNKNTKRFVNAIVFSLLTSNIIYINFI